MKIGSLAGFFCDFSGGLRNLGWVGLLAVTVGCTVEPLETTDLPEATNIQEQSTIIGHTESLSRPEIRALRWGTRETVVTGITAAENIMFSTTGRLYVSGDDGVFELVRDSAQKMVATVRATADSCKFGGMAEYANTLYAVCYDNIHSYLYAANETNGPVFEHIHTLENITTANGLASDGQGGLYTTTTMQGMILHLEVDENNPMLIKTQQPWLSYSGGLLPNGIKIHDSTVYWGDFGTIRRCPLSQPTTLLIHFTGLTFFDDFYVDDDGILIADYLFGSVLAYSPTGRLLGGTLPFTFASPSAVIPAEGRLGFSHRDLLITEKGPGNVAVFHF